jgi:hypothetical protein
MKRAIKRRIEELERGAGGDDWAAVRVVSRDAEGRLFDTRTGELVEEEPDVKVRWPEDAGAAL